MKIELTPIVGASLIDNDVQPDARAVQTTADESCAQTEAVMGYEELLPYLWLPMAGAY